jgi:hypothetical protein
MSRWPTMTRMTSFLRLFVNKVSNFHLFFVAFLGCSLLLVARNRGRLRKNKPFWRCTLRCRGCPYVLFSYYSHICAFCPFIALYSPLIFLQQRLLESLIRAEKWGVLLCLFTFWFVWCPNFTRIALLTLCSLSPSCFSFITVCHDSVLILDSYCFRSLGLGSLLIVAACYCFFVRGLIFAPSFASRDSIV